MLELALALCGLIVLLFFLLIIFILQKSKKAGLITGMLMSFTAIIALILFVIVQKANGNPDSGKEFVQFYFPISVFLVFIAIGFISSIRLDKK